MTPRALNDRLLGRIDEVCRELLPNGKRVGGEWVCGDLSGQPGRSCRVHLTGDKAGVWSDFQTGDKGGDLLDLWAAARRLTLFEAMREAKAWLGIADPVFEPKRRPSHRRPARPEGIRRPGLVADYLNRRGLSDDTIAKFQIAEDARGNIVFPYKREGALLGLKYMALARPEGKKRIWVEPDCEPCLFGWQALDPQTRAVTLCEGEIDAMTLHQMGIAALSLPFGGGGGDKQRWIEYEYPHLERFDQIVLCLDQDAAGQAAVAELLDRLGRHRCRVMELPYKDANDALLAGVQAQDFARWLTAARVPDPDELKNAGAFVEEVISEFYPSPEHLPGIRLPWEKVGHKVLLRPGEVSIWTGWNGSGKALALDTPIITPQGWRRLGEIRPGDEVFDDQGKPCRVVAETPVMIGRPCYRVVFSDGCEIIADAEHEWLTCDARARQSWRSARQNDRLLPRPLKKRGTDQSHKRKRPALVTTRQIAETLTVRWNGGNRINNHSIPVAGALQYPPKDLPIAPSLLGIWLGDGSAYEASITTADQALMVAFAVGGYRVTQRQNKYSYGVCGGFNAQLRELNVIKDKHIPESYLRGSVAQRLALLQGLMDTDGYVSATTGRCEFTSINLSLAVGVKELVLSLGMQATLMVGRATLNGKDCGPKYRVLFTPSIPVFKLERKADRIKPAVSQRLRHRFIVACDPVGSVPVKCIQVDSPSHLYLAGESMIPTHNSLILGYLMVHGMAERARVCMASLEMQPRKTLARMIRQITGLDQPSVPYIRAVHDWLGDKLWLFDVVGTAKTDALLAIMEYARRRYATSQFIIDSLAKCGLSEDDYRAQKAFVETLSDFARKHNAHVHLVAHARKGNDENNPPGKMDVKGSGAITDMCDNVFSVWRNKPKEELLERVGAEESGDIEERPDAVLACVKQRYGAWEGKIALWFDHQSLQYRGGRHEARRRYVEFSLSPPADSPQPV